MVNDCTMVTQASLLLANKIDVDSDSDHIMPYLSPEAAASLRSVMDSPPDQNDGPGYVYCFEIVGRCFSPCSQQNRMLMFGLDGDSLVTTIKVGSATNPVLRIANLKSRCKLEPIIRGWWPGSLAYQPAPFSSVPSPAGKFCRAVESKSHT